MQNNYLKKLNKKNIQINIFPILILAFVWTYGYYGALAGIGGNPQLIISFILLSILVYLFYSYEYLISYDNKISIIKISNEDIKVFSIVLLIVGIFSLKYLNFSIDGDELYHSLTSQAHSILGLLLISNKLPNVLEVQPMWLLVWLISLAILAGSIGLIYVVNKLDFKYKFLLLSIIAFLLFRLITISFGLNSTHPPFRLFPLSISSTILSPSNFSFRLPGIMALSFIGLMVFKALKTKINSFFTRLMVVFTVISIPVLFHNSYIVEPSIWATVFTTYWLISLSSNKLNKLSFFTWFSLIAIFILMRQSLIFVLPAMLFIYIYEMKSKLWSEWKNTIFTISPLILVVPFIFGSIVIGTPASAIIENEIQYSLFEKLQHVISSGILREVLVQNVGIWLFFVFFAFIPPKTSRIRYIFTLLIFTICAFIVFYAIRPTLWGIPRYQIEHILPLVILGIIRISTLETITNKRNYLLIPSLLSLFIYNIYTINTSHKLEVETVNGHKTITSHPIYDYESAFKEAKKHGYAGNMFVFGEVNGILNEVLYGYTLLETTKNYDIYKSVIKDEKQIKNIINNNDIRLVLISDPSTSKKEDVLNELLKYNFKFWKKFSNANSTDKIIGVVRKTSNDIKN